MMRATGRHDELPALQLQYETEFGKAISVLLEASRHGSWQYLADFPYRMLSTGTKRAVLLKYFAGDDMGALEVSFRRKSKKTGLYFVQFYPFYPVLSISVTDQGVIAKATRLNALYSWNVFL